MLIPVNIARGILVATIVLAAVPCWAQRVRFPESDGATRVAFQPGAGNGAFTAPGANNLVPVQPSAPAPATPTPGFAPNTGTPGFTAPANTAPQLLGPPPFDPYATQSGAAAPSTLGTPLPPSGGSPASGFGPPTQPLYTPPGTVVAPGQSGYTGQPSALYPNGYYPNVQGQGVFGNSGLFGGQGMPQPGPYLKLLEDWRVVHTWIEGDGPRELDSNDVEVATTLNLPNFLFSGHPIAISPGFIFHFWDGPKAPFAADLPARAYSTYLDFGWNPMATQRFGGEIAARIGVYTDFQTVTRHSIRITGKALFVYHFTPKLTIKGGIEYLDRVEIKMLPAGGVVWQPNDRVYFDVYFPKPKLAQYLITLGNTEVWWYLAGEYGYGSWTVERALTGASNRVDVNDLRVIGGLEWKNNASTFDGFIELGYVFDREIRYAEMPADDLQLEDSFMLRSGISF